MNLNNLPLYFGRFIRLAALPLFMLVQRPRVFVASLAVTLGWLVMLLWKDVIISPRVLVGTFLGLIYLAEVARWLRHHWKLALISVAIMAFSLLGLRYYLITHDECRGYLENAGHQLRPQVTEILYSCLAGNDRSVRLAMKNGLEAGRIEKELTFWFDCDPLVEFLAAKISLLPDGWVRTFGPLQLHYLTAQEVYRRYRHDLALNTFLGIHTPAESDDLATTTDKCRIVEGLKLRCRGSIILSHLLVHELWMGLENGVDTQTMGLAVENTRLALVEAKASRKFHDVTRNETPAEVRAARQWILGSLNLRLQPRLGLYVMAAYAGGLDGGRDADVQACLNEWRVVMDRPTELIPVDGDWGKQTEAVVTEFLGRPQQAGESHTQRREAVWAKWRIEVEPRLYTLLIGTIRSGNPAQMMPLLKNRYVGHVAVYNALNDLLACPEMDRLSKLDKRASFEKVATAWDGWTRDRDAHLWRFLTDARLYEETFHPQTTELYQETLVRMVAQ